LPPLDVPEGVLVDDPRGDGMGGQNPPTQELLRADSHILLPLLEGFTEARGLRTGPPHHPQGLGKRPSRLGIARLVSVDQGLLDLFSRRHVSCCTCSRAHRPGPVREGCSAPCLLPCPPSAARGRSPTSSAGDLSSPQATRA